MTDMLNCNIVVSELELHLQYNVPLWFNTLGKGMNSFIPQAMSSLVLLLFFLKDGFCIKYSTNLDMPSNKEIKPNQYYCIAAPSQTNRQ